MRIAAIVYIIITVVANFFIDNLTVLLLAMLSFPVLLWLLLKKRKTKPVKHSPHKEEKAQPVSN